jgi:hypothetical protein
MNHINIFRDRPLAVSLEHVIAEQTLAPGTADVHTPSMTSKSAIRHYAGAVDSAGEALVMWECG